MSGPGLYMCDVPAVALVDHVQGDCRPLSLTVALEVAVMAEQLEDEAAEDREGAC